jgi:hypothetical protein
MLALEIAISGYNRENKRTYFCLMPLWTGNAGVSRKGAKAFMQLIRSKARRLGIAAGRYLQAVTEAPSASSYVERLYMRAW